MDANILKMVKLHISYPEPIGGIHGESLWATPLKNSTYRLENNPVIEGLFYRDIVKAYYDDGILEFKAFVMRDSQVEVEAQAEALSQEDVLSDDDVDNIEF